jgi:hypothetical protein
MIGDTFEYVDRYFGIQILPELNLSKREKMVTEQTKRRKEGEKCVPTQRESGRRETPVLTT